MSEADKRPAKRRATITIDIEGKELVIKGKWMDEHGKRHDLGFAKLPTFEQAEFMLQGMGRRLSSIAGWYLEPVTGWPGKPKEAKRTVDD